MVQGVIPNQGQWPEEVLAQASGPNGTLWVTRTALVYDRVEVTADSLVADGGRATRQARLRAGRPVGFGQEGVGADQQEPTTRVVRSRQPLPGGAASQSLTALRETATRVGYSLGDDPSRWVDDVPVYEAARLEVGGAAFLIETSGGGFSVLNEGRATSDWAEEWLAGMDTLARSARATRRAETDGVVFARYLSERVDDVVSDGSGGAWVAGYTQSADPSVTIGPGGGLWDVFVARVSSTGALISLRYMGGSDSDLIGRGGARGMVSDGSGGVWVAGRTESSDFPVTTGPPFGGGSDVIVARISSTGALAFARYLGGGDHEGTSVIAPDGSGGVWVAGRTESSDFPVTTGPDFGGSQDGFVGQVSGAGALVSLRYLGGSRSERAEALVPDGSGGVWVAGYTRSPDFPVTTGPDFGGSQDGFVGQVSGAGALVSLRYLGGSGGELLEFLVSDGSEGVWAVGRTESSDFPVTTGPPYSGGLREGFAARVSSAGELVAARYLGSRSLYPDDAVSDGSGGVWVAGAVIPPSHDGVFEGFVVRVSPTGALAAARYLDGIGDDSFNGIPGVVPDGSGGVWVAGSTRLPDFPVTTGPDFGGESDVLVARVSATGALTSARYLGGSGGDYVRSIAPDGSGGVWIAGVTLSHNFPVTIGPDQSVVFHPGFVALLGGSGGGALPPDLIVTGLSVTPEAAEPGGAVQVDFGVFNQGDAPALPSTANVRLNQDPDDVTRDHLLLAQVEVPAIDSNTSLPRTANVTLPDDLDPGTYYIWVIADVGSTAGQENEDNDRAVVPITVEGRVGTPGTTVIAHGFNGPDGLLLIDDGLDSDQNWALTLAEAVVERVQGGRVWTVVDGEVELHFSTGSSDGEQVVVFDWLRESVYDEFGYSEGAADALFAVLLDGERQGRWSLDQLHMIGHSRGTVVLSEVIQRLGVASRQSGVVPSGVDIDGTIHFTLLDPHPWDDRPDDGIADPSTAEDYDVNGPVIDHGVVCWSNVGFADIYWQKDVLDSFGNIAEGAWIKNLNGLSRVPGCDGFVRSVSTDLSALSEMTHGGVHAWYHGTVDLDAPSDGADATSDGAEPADERIGIPVGATWYPVAGAELGPVSDRDVGGFNRARSVADPADVFDIVLNAGRPSPTSDETYKPYELHNGDFGMGRPLLAASVFTPPSKEGLSGWLFQGGGGDGRRLSYFGNSALSLDQVRPEHTTNVTWVPRGADRLTFRLRGPFLWGGRLNVYADGDDSPRELIRQLDLAGAAGPQHAEIPPDRRGTAQRFTFEVEPTGLPIRPDVYLDDVGFGSVPAYVAAHVSVPVASAARRSTSADASGVASFFAYAPDGRATGIAADGTTTIEIAGSRVFGDRAEDGTVTLSLTLPPGPAYRFEVVAGGAVADADVFLEEAVAGGDLIAVAFRDVDLAPGGVARATASTVDGDVVLVVDSDGDGTADEERAPTETERTVYVTASATGGGSVAPSGRLAVRTGTDIAFAATPDEGFVLLDVLLNGESVGPDATFTLEGIESDRDVAFVFGDAPPDATACAVGVPLGIGAFDADGDDPAHDEFAEVLSGAAGPVDLSACSFVAFDPFTERVTFSAGPDLDVVGRAVLATRDGDTALPPGSLPDGPGAIALVEGAVPVGASVRSVLGRVVSAVVYVDDDRVFGRTGWSPDDARTTRPHDGLAEVLAAFRESRPDEVSLALAGPNPVGRGGAVEVALPEGGPVTVSVFDLLGREVARLADGEMGAGRHTVALDAGALPSGVYVVRLVAGGGVHALRLTVAR